MTHQQITAALAEAFVERASQLDYKGKKRDDAALDYFVGAAISAKLKGDNGLHDHLGRVGLFIIAVRGYQGVLDLIEPTRRAA